MSERKKNQGRKVGNNRKSPARNRYWASLRLEKRKIRHLVRCCGFSETQAYAHWHSQRQGRRTRSAYVSSGLLVTPRGK